MLCSRPTSDKSDFPDASCVDAHGNLIDASTFVYVRAGRCSSETIADHGGHTHTFYLAQKPLRKCASFACICRCCRCCSCSCSCSCSCYGLQNTTKWVKNALRAKGGAGKDDRKAIAEQLRLGQELREKVCLGIVRTIKAGMQTKDDD